MKKSLLSASALTALCLMLVGTSIAQDGDKSKNEKAKTREKLGEYEEIIIRKKTDADTKVTVEIKDGEVKVDGKPIDDYESDAVSVRRRKPSVITYKSATSPFRAGDITVNGNYDSWAFDSTRAFLGISTNESKDGVRVVQVTDESAAEKAGLKPGDIIVNIDDKKIEEPGDVTSAIRKHKADDKVTITYKRNDKESKVTATLGKQKPFTVQGYANGNLFPQMEKLKSMDNLYFDAPQAFRFNGPGALNEMIAAGRPRLGIRAQDTEESNGAKVLDVSDESAAEKAGIAEGDVITSFDGKKVTNADELSAAAREARDKSSIEVKFNRDGKGQTVQIKIPKKLKTTSL